MSNMSALADALERGTAWIGSTADWPEGLTKQVIDTLRESALESVRSEALDQGDKLMQAKLSGFNEGLKEAAKVADEWGSYLTAKRIRALQSPARVAEGGPVREALSNLVSLLLQTMGPIGPMRDRKDYPPELQTAINVLRASPDVHSTELRK